MSGSVYKVPFFVSYKEVQNKSSPTYSQSRHLSQSRHSLIKNLQLCEFESVQNFEYRSENIIKSHKKLLIYFSKNKHFFYPKLTLLKTFFYSFVEYASFESVIANKSIFRLPKGFGLNRHGCGDNQVLVHKIGVFRTFFRCVLTPLSPQP
jgi:hypothetical protein